MDDFPAKLADLLETTAGRVRALTVDRVAQWTKMAALWFVAVSLGGLAAIFLGIGLFRLLSSVIGVTPAYAVLAGLFLAVGLFLWIIRTRPAKEGS
jgi:hypothetical protein